MVLMRSESTPEGSTPPTDDEIFERVMARRSGYALGLGHGVVPPSSRSVSHMSCEVRVHEANLRAAASAAQAEQAAREAAEMRLQAEQAARDAAAAREAFTKQEQRLKAQEEWLARMDAVLAAMQTDRSSR
uniref:Uncharacterized protein n=1 Tax=Davidia involucrata TaxID=16924 RepID=A0A5B7A3L4_DAVIN